MLDGKALRWLGLTLLGLGSLGFGCANIDGGGGTGGGGTGGGGTGGGGTGGGGTGGVVVQDHVNLYECGLPLACEQLVNHVDVGPWTAMNCAAKLIVSGSPGVLSAINAPGGGCIEDEQLIVVQGDGKALVQTRHRQDDSHDSCKPGVPWQASSAHQLCDIVLSDGLEEACQADEKSACEWSPYYAGELSGCVEVEDRTCEEVAALLE